jgi:hypothetical protein
MMSVCHLNSGAMVTIQARHKYETLLKNLLKQKGLGHGSSITAPAWQYDALSSNSSTARNVDEKRHFLGTPQQTCRHVVSVLCCPTCVSEMEAVFVEMIVERCYLNRFKFQLVFPQARTDFAKLREKFLSGCLLVPCFDVRYWFMSCLFFFVLNKRVMSDWTWIVRNGALTGDFLHDTPCQLHILPSGLSSH